VARFGKRGYKLKSSLAPYAMRSSEACSAEPGRKTASPMAPTAQCSELYPKPPEYLPSRTNPVTLIPHHVVWAMKQREPILTSNIESVVHGFLREKATAAPGAPGDEVTGLREEHPINRAFKPRLRRAAL